MKYLIIQPRCGEVMRYCSHLVLNDSKDTAVVLTIESNKRRVMNESNLFRMLGVRFRYFNDFDLESDEDIKDRQTQMDIECQIQEFLNIFFKENRKEETIVVIPLGNKDSLSAFIKDCIERLLSIVWYYNDSSNKVDWPYMRLYAKDIVEIFDVKSELIKRFYKEEIKPNKEIIYINKEQELPF